MTYSISSDIDGQTVNPKLLQEEIVASNLVPDFSGIVIQGDSLEIYGTATDKAALDLVVKNHDSHPLAKLKAEKILAIDTRTEEIIAGGFTFDAHQFSLSQNAQMNWLGMTVLQGALSWPVGVTDQTDRTYSLALADLPAFVGTGMAVIKSAVDSGRTLKEAALNSANKTELAAVVDAR